MFYDSLLLNNGGGVVSATRNRNSLAVQHCIGIGSTGVDALYSSSARCISSWSRTAGH